jgi:hypothetical protein
VGAAAPACNGVPGLCALRLDQVVIPATHNSYAASEQPGWHFASQRYGIGRQLDDGVRGLLIDVHHGLADPGGGPVRTDFGAPGADRNKVVRELSPAAVRVAERVAGPLGVGMPSGPSRLYLCHTLCELGAEPLARELGVVRDFLATHRREVVVLVVEDYVPPAEIERAFAAAGLDREVVELDRRGPLPTLGSLVDSDRRLVVFAEKEGGSPPWYMPAFEYIQDTPLGARTPRGLSCERFRGEPSSPLLMINHWIPPFPPSTLLNARIGRARFLRERIDECRRERGREGAIVAVDFYERGAVVDVARELDEAAVAAR